MEVTRLSSEGLVAIPESLRLAQHWEAGQELIASKSCSFQQQGCEVQHPSGK